MSEKRFIVKGETNIPSLVELDLVTGGYGNKVDLCFVWLENEITDEEYTKLVEYYNNYYKYKNGGCNNEKNK